MEDIIQVCNVSFSYNGEGKKVLHDISFEVKKGEILAVIGENDSGKSTLCQILVGLIPHYITGELEGDVIIEDTKISDLSMGELATKIGLVFQNPFNQLTYTTSTVRDELAFGLGNIGVPRDEMLLLVAFLYQNLIILPRRQRLFCNCDQWVRDPIASPFPLYLHPVNINCWEKAVFGPY